MRLTNSSVWNDIKSNKVTFSILCFGMLPLWMNGYCGYVLAILFPYLFITRYNAISICIALFSIFYTYVQYFGDVPMTPSSVIFNLFFPIIVFQTGIYLCNKFRNNQTQFVLLILMGFCLALPASISSLQDWINTGLLINPLRSILDSHGDTTRAATGYGMMVSIMCGCSGCLLLPTKNKVDRLIKYTLIIGFLGGLFTTIHLINRTGVVIIALSFLIAFLYSSKNSKNITYIICILIILSIVYAFFISNSDEYSNIIEMYSSRDSGVSSIGSAGGRDERWLAGINQIFTQPFGNPNGLWFEGRYNYAHNIILDSGVKGGIICFILMIILIVNLILSSKKLIQTKSKYTTFDRCVILLISSSLILQCMVEPVIEGLPQIFWYLLFFSGLIYNTNDKRPLIK